MQSVIVVICNSVTTIPLIPVGRGEKARAHFIACLIKSANLQYLASICMFLLMSETFATHSNGITPQNEDDFKVLSFRQYFAQAKREPRS